MEKSISFPVDKLSYSALTQLLRNPLMFKLKYILGVYTGKDGMSRMIGSACHTALQFYYGGNEDMPVPADASEARAQAMQLGLDYIQSVPDENIRYGKTGSREAMLKGFAQAIKHYWEEEPEYHEILFCEDKLEGELHNREGQVLPLTAVGRPDLVVRNADGSVDIVDTKFTKNFTRYENEDGDPHEDYVKIVQAIFMQRLVAEAGVKAGRMVFREIKISKNKEGGAQIRDYVIPLDHEPYHIIFDNLYRDVVEFLKQPDAIYLPNLSDPFDGENAGFLYAQGLISSDMSDVEVIHKVKDVARVSKKFVSSKLERVENAHLDPEERIRVRLGEFGIPVVPDGVHYGPSVIQYRFKVSAGISMARFKKHKDDIASVLEAKGAVRILAPIPGTSLVGVEVERADREIVKLKAEHLREGTLSLPIGVHMGGEVETIPLDGMPHLLIAGTTGAGKSVLIHNLITALTKQKTPDELDLFLIDPKRVELAPYARKPHVHGRGVVYEHEHAVRTLIWLVDEMERRYKLLERTGKRDLGEYNASKKKAELRVPYVVVIIDEFADLIIRARMDKEGANLEFLMVRLAQMGRAAGIHLIVATQRPSVDVITGLIKANFPTRIALTTASETDSKVILGTPGAEKLGGKGDMLFRFPGNKGNVRLQGFAK